MHDSSRTKNSILNIIFNFLQQALIIFFSFFSRRVFIETLGIEYLGISSLFTNVISILNFTELGISGAINYSLYKLLANKDEAKIKGLLTYYKKLYNIIAALIFLLGIMLLPFLDFIIKTENEIPYLKLYYFVELISTVSTYLFVYKTCIVSADQKGYKFKSITILFALLKTILQCVALLLFKNYLIFIIIGLVFNLVQNIVCSIFATKWYPIVREKGELSKKEKKLIWSNIKDMFIYKFSGILINNTDNILISVLINTITVGIYSNYTMLINKISGIVNLVFNSLIASIGNLNANTSKQKQYEFFNILLFLTFGLMFISTIGMLFVGEDVIMTVTQTKEYLFSFTLLLIVSVNYYSSGINNPIWVYRSTTGLFKMAKWSMLLCVTLNLVLSVILGYFLGLNGILIATIISRALTNLWYEPFLLYKKIFEVSPKEYFLKQVKYAIVVVITAFALYPLITSINIEHLYIRIFVKSLVCLFLPLAIIVLLYHRTYEFNYLIDKTKYIFNKALKNKSE